MMVVCDQGCHTSDLGLGRGGIMLHDVAGCLRGDIRRDEGVALLCTRPYGHEGECQIRPFSFTTNFTNPRIVS